MVTNISIPDVGNAFEEIYGGSKNNSSSSNLKKSIVEVGNAVEEIYGSSTKQPTEV